MTNQTPREQRAQLFEIDDQDAISPFALVAANEIKELHDENARLRAQVAALVEAGSSCADVLASFIRSDGDYSEAIAVIKTMKAALAAAESEAANG